MFCLEKPSTEPNDEETGSTCKRNKRKRNEEVVGSKVVVPGKRNTRLMSKLTLNRTKSGEDDDGTKSSDDADMQSKRMPKRVMSKPLKSVTEHISFPSKGSANGAIKMILPAKRVNRLKSTPCPSSQPVVVLSPIKEAGDKNKRAIKQRGAYAIPNICDADVSSLIAMNCKLTSEVLDAKKLLSDKNNALLKIQKECFEEQLKVVALEKSNTEKDQQIDILRKEIEDIKAERFCTDLIRFDEEGHLQVTVNNPENTAQTHPTDLLDSYLEPEDEVKADESVLQKEPGQELAQGNSGFQWTPTE